jgi:hypothetical protein
MARPGFAFAWHAFELVALQGGMPQQDLTFGAPVTVTINYSAQNVRLVSDHSQLRLYWWIGNEWQDAAETCTPALSYALDAEQRILSVPVCHPGQFAIFGPTHLVYLPMIFHEY